MTTKYTPDHEWINIEDHLTAVVGITPHAQEALGDVVFVELPEVGRSYAKGEVAGVVESVKAAADLYAPLSGEVVAANGELDTAPQSINEDAYSAWLFKLKPSDPAELARLLDAPAYDKLAAADTR